MRFALNSAKVDCVHSFAHFFSGRNARGAYVEINSENERERGKNISSKGCACISTFNCRSKMRD